MQSPLNISEVGVQPPQCLCINFITWNTETIHMIFFINTDHNKYFTIKVRSASQCLDPSYTALQDASWIEVS